MDVLGLDLIDQKHLIDVGILVGLAWVLLYHGLVKSEKAFFILLTLVFLDVLTFFNVVLLLERLVHRRAQLLAEATEKSSIFLLGSLCSVICLGRSLIESLFTL